jgi:hypothetical protein
VRHRRVGPSVGEGSKPGFLTGAGRENVEQVKGRARESVGPDGDDSPFKVVVALVIVFVSGIGLARRRRAAEAFAKAWVCLLCRHKTGETFDKPPRSVDGLAGALGRDVGTGGRSDSRQSL